MAVLSYSFKKGGQENLRVSWQGNYENLIIWHNGMKVSELAKLDERYQVQLNDGSVVQVSLFDGQLSVTRDGKPLPSVLPGRHLGLAYGIIFSLAGFNILLAAIALSFNIQFLQDIGFGLYSIVFGIIFGVLGFFVMRRSTVALAIAVGLYALDTIAILVTGLANDTFSFLPILWHVVFIIWMCRGFGAIKELKSEALPEQSWHNI